MAERSKDRLDRLVQARGLADSRHKAQALIVAGQVLVNDQVADKAGRQYPADCLIRLKDKPCPYVSRGGLKLEKGLDYFNIDPAGLTCADIGASTGGFTDCLLQRNAAMVYAIDVGYGQLAWQLRNDPRVVVMERTNARYLTPDDLTDPIDLAVIDAAFISLKLLLPPLLPLFRAQKEIIALIKPQFEAGRDKIGKGGVVRDPETHQAIINDIIDFTAGLGLTGKGVTPSPILGPKGNKEFLIHLTGPASNPDR